MCKCCQSCFDSCYWHCFGKWSFDEDIATYEDPISQEKDHRAIDNLAFWDSVSVIANRNVVTIQPLPNRDDVTDYNTRANSNIHELKTKPETQPDKINIPYEPETTNQIKQYITNVEPDKVALRKKSTMEEKCDKQRSGSISQDPNRKKSLKERRKSAAGLTLKLENDFHEIPVIRQSSVPKFYLDTPEMSSLHPNYGSERSSVLTSPVLPNSPNWNLDLRSVVQIEKEHASHSKPATPKTKRLTQVRKKLIPILHKKPSTKSLPDSINNI